MWNGSIWKVASEKVTILYMNTDGACRDHPARLNTPVRPIVNEYREGKVKSTPTRGVK